MSNGSDHRLYAAVSVFAATAPHWNSKDHWSKHPVIAACIAGGCGTLPDLLEPATNPNHRQFFHSVVFMGAIAVLMHKLYEWDPDTEGKKIARRLLLIACGAYLVHLAMDSTTPKSLPFIGK
jgi:membrane-bound metal-dependent hydrolase YbcI (DUF457 family)